MSEETAVAPVTKAARVASLDVLRGIAVLGILMMNITGFGLLPHAYGNPLVEGGADGRGRLHIEIDRERHGAVPLQVRLKRGQPVRTAGSDDDRRAGRCERARKVHAETRRGAGHEGHLAAKVESLGHAGRSTVSCRPYRRATRSEKETWTSVSKASA